jgi:hypothetical protein
MEQLRYCGELPQDMRAYQQYLADVRRGKSLQQLMGVRMEMTDEIRRSWSARSFTPVITPQGIFDEVVCNISYHFHKHGEKYYSITRMTEEAKSFWANNQGRGRLTNEGLLKFPEGNIYEPDGRIVTFVT